jgi:hypothetical protein
MTLLSLDAPSHFGSTPGENLTVFVNLDHGIAGRPRSDVVGAIRHLCGYLLPGDRQAHVLPQHFVEGARSYYRAIRATDASGVATLDFLAHVTTYFHEIRHAHDLLATCYGQDVLFRTANICQNVPVMLWQLGQWQAADGSRHIPIPLRGNLDGLAGIDPAFRRLMQAYEKLISDLDEYDASAKSSAGLKTIHLLEANALEIQLGLISELFGDEAVFDMLKFVRSNDQSNTYLKIREEVTDAFLARGFTRAELAPCLSYLVWASLMGTTFPNAGWAEGPTSVALFEALCQEVVGGEKASLEETKALVELFCARWGLLPPRAVYQRFVAQKRPIAIRMKKAWADRSAPVDQDFGAAYASFLDEFENLAKKLIEGQIPYWNPGEYAAAVLLGQLPSVSMKVQMDGELHDYMSRGYRSIGHDSWNLVSVMSTSLRLLHDRGSEDTTSWEDLCWREMLARPWNGQTLRFKDVTAVFDWDES